MTEMRRLPEAAESLMEEASMLHRQGRRQEAITLFGEVVSRFPEAGEAWYELGYLLKAEGRHLDALDAYDQALRCNVRQPEEVHLNRGVIYADHLRRDDEAERELKCALAIAPRYVPALLNLGNLHEERGEREPALACYERILEDGGANDQRHEELRSEALARIAKLRPPEDLADPLMENLRAAVSAQTNNTVRANLLFALGQAYDRLTAYDLAFEAFAKANRWLLRQSGRQYEPARFAEYVDALIASFPADGTIAGQAAAQGVQPLFICGMFRSGSTLVEQVLAAHPQVTAGGEMDYLRRLTSKVLAPFPESMHARDPAREAVLAEDYRAHVARLYPESVADTFVTDKRPDNYLLLGLVKRLFPGAKIVHTVRNPLDNCLSVFMQHLNLQVAGYSCDMGDIGHYYGQYRRLMAHWTAAYPKDIIEFDYDAFVAAPRPALQRLLDFLDLPWDDRCLDFHRLGNTVKTASYWQVRRPLYATASGRWRNYERHLGPLRKSLADAGVDLVVEADDRTLIERPA